MIRRCLALFQILLRWTPNIPADRDRAGVYLALQLARWVFDVGLHQLTNGRVECDERPSVFRKVVHENVVALLRILPQIEHLRHGRHVFVGALPAEIGIHRQSARLLAVVAALHRRAAGVQLGWA